MATNTYVALDKVTISGTSTSAVTFSSIPATYTDLIIVCDVGSESTNAFTYIQFNGDTGSNYSNTEVAGSGTSIGTSRGSNISQLFNSNISVKQGALSSTVVYQIMNYANTTTYKSALARQGVLDAADYNGTNMQVGMWRNTAAINSVSIKLTRGGTGYNFSSGSTFSLYGIRAEGASPTTKATGGTVYSDSTYYYHVFGASGTFTPTQSITADVLMVGGGGSGSTGKTGTYYGSGGGAGQVVAYTSQSLSTSNYTVTIGAGGAAIGGSTLDTNGNAGTSTSFTGLTSASGGGGGIVSTGTGGTSGNGYAGGSPSGAACGGGGGSGAVGVNAGSPAGGNGGIGTTSYSSWLSATGTGRLVSGSYYIAGGGAGSYPNGYGGYGGGGGDPLDYTAATQAGKINTGSGGAGGNYSSVASGVGGSGLVIVRYAK